MPFDLRPTLVGDLLELRRLRPDDFDALYAVASDPLVWEQHPAHDRWKPDVFAAFFREALDSGGAFVVTDRKDGRVIGSSRFARYDPDRSQIEIGWTFLARSHWGGAYNGEMKRLMLRHAFRFVENVVFVVGPENWRSQRAVEKIGGVRVGFKTDAKTGRQHVVFRITRPSSRAGTGNHDELCQTAIRDDPTAAHRGAGGRGRSRRARKCSSPTGSPGGLSGRRRQKSASLWLSARTITTPRPSGSSRAVPRARGSRCPLR